METLKLTHHDSSAQLECHFDVYTGSLHFCMIGDDCIYNLLSQSVIEEFESQYLKHVKQRNADLALEMALEKLYD